LQRIKLNPQKVKEAFDYQDGQLINRKTGNRVGYVYNARGYLRVTYKHARYLVHQLVFAWHHGHFPTEIDHLDRDPGNNRIENLRACTRSENNCNKGLYANNTSGCAGINWRKDISKWQVRVRVLGKETGLGTFADLERAKAALQEHYDKSM